MCFGPLQIDCAGGYLDSWPQIRLAGDESAKAAGRAKQLMKNLPRDGRRKSRGEDFDFLQLGAGSASLQSIPTGSTASCAFATADKLVFPDASRELRSQRKAVTHTIKRLPRSCDSWNLC